MLTAFTGDAFLARSALLQEAEALGLAPRLLPPDVTVLAQELSGGLFGPQGAAIDLREITESEWKPVKEILERLPSDALVLLLDPKPTAGRSKWYGEARTRNLPTPQGRDLQLWLERQAKVLGFELPKPVASYLAGLINSKGSAENPASGLEALHQELRKLALASSPITLEKARQLVAIEAPLSGFDLVRAVTEGRKPDAFKQLGALMESGEDPIRILGALSWQYSKVARAWQLLAENPGASEAEAAKQLGIHPFAAKQSLALAKKMGGERVELALETLIEAELAGKTGRDPRLALERATSALLNQKR